MIAKYVLPLVMTVWMWGPPTGAVSEVRIAEVEGETEITVVLEGDVAVEDFLLTNPARLILDLRNAANALPGRTFEGVGRGGVIRVRSSQFREETVRLVFDLTRAMEYRLDREEGTLRVSFPNPGEAFAPWTTNGGSHAASGGSVGASPASGGSAAPGPAGSTRAERSGSAGADAVPEVQPMASRNVPRASDQPRITVAFDSASMLDVLAGFSEFAGVSIVPNGEVGGVVVRGIDVRNQPWDVALSAILSAQGLGWNTTESGIIIVDNLENLAKREELTTETRVFRVNYASADSVARTLQELATRERGQVVSYQGTNSVIVTDAPSVVARMDSLVRALDRRTPQVSIEAKIVFVDRTDVNELGIVYDLKQRDNGFVEQGINDAIAVPDPNQPPQIVRIGDEDFAFYRMTNETIVDIGGDAIAALANANDRLAAPALQILTSLAFGNFSLFTFIEALESHQLSDVQAAPSIQVVDNHRARIQVGERTPIRVLERGAQVEDATVNVQFEDTGIILEVTPHITNNNQILLDLSAERSSLQVGLADVGFIFNRQIGETRLLLDDGETAVIGGLTLSELTRSESGIPGLMNLPVLGNLFRTSREQERKQDLIILVTPHIVFPGQAGAPAQ